MAATPRRACAARFRTARDVWKYSRYFDNPQFWSSPGTPGQQGVQDVVLTEIGVPEPDDPDQVVPYRRTVKTTPLPDETEMYDVSRDPMELQNLAGNPAYAGQEQQLAALLAAQCARQRRTPTSGQVPGEPTCEEIAVGAPAGRSSQPIPDRWGSSDPGRRRWRNR